MDVKYVEYYVKEIGAIKLELSELPEGHLTRQESRYYETNGTIRRGITNDPQRIRQLARKAYLSRRLKHLEWNFSLVKKQYERCKTEDPVEIIKSLPSFYRQLPAEYYYHSSAYDLSKDTSEENAGYADELVYLTQSGIRVRSKSERIIADALFQCDIPYKYEALLEVGGKKVHPDFTVSRPFNGKTVLWEHFGLLGNEEYLQKAAGKLAFYAKHGFFPFDNLICTYEQDLLDPARIDAIIEMFLLR